MIYVRVSTKEQTENLSLPTQLRACEEYCRRQEYEVLERFHEEGESAKSTDRSQLQNLLTFCRLNKGRVHFVVVFNLTRFARDKYDHFALRSHLQSLGISLHSDRTHAGMKTALEFRSTEMALREGASGAGLQVAFEGEARPRQEVRSRRGVAKGGSAPYEDTGQHCGRRDARKCRV